MKFKWDKNSKYRFLRNIPASWIHQALNAHDRTELIFRLTAEMSSVIIIFFVLLQFMEWTVLAFISSIIIMHTFFWIFNHGIFVVLIVSFSFLHNGGIKKSISFLEYLKNIFEKADCAKAILIYGSMSRNKFHSRSDIDLRILRKDNFFLSIKCMVLAVWIRMLATIKRIPLDLLVVDSMKFLNSQMRSDEKPIIVLQAESYSIPKFNESKSFAQLLQNPESFLRSHSS